MKLIRETIQFLLMVGCIYAVVTIVDEMIQGGQL